MDEALKIILNYITDLKGQDWCNDLVNGDDDCKRLAICIALEMRSGSEEVLVKAHLDQIFYLCDYEKNLFSTDNAYPRKWFSKRLDNLKGVLRNKDGAIIPTTQLILDSINTNRYVTTLTFSRLKKFYLDKLGFYVGVDENNPNNVLNFITLYPDLFDELSFFGNKDFPIWVTTHDEIERIKSDNARFNVATNVMNMLGLQPDTPNIKVFPNTWDMLFVIEYPNTLKITAYQPSSLNKNWLNATNDLYLSYKKDNCFGKTYATDASCKCADEQIHEPFVCKSKGLRIRYLGKYLNLTIDKSKIISEGLNRLAI